ncbi:MULTISPECIES: PKD domain-containing protein [unclassified Pseudomonas]|uniref:PKD domain-containing protein n=1 Tax=unclassified Pseudomonas TaxID=196821 RepID=UPI0021158BCF|nr:MULTISPECIES: PKD domain-containing protein [unclassified Pseudomonas]
MSSFRLNALSRATRLWGASLSTALLLPLSGMAQADASQHSPDATLEAKVTQGHFINLQLPGARAMPLSAAEAGSEQLQQVTGMRIRNLIPRQDDTFKDLRVMTGQLEGRARTLSAPGEMTLAARPDGSFIALLPDANAIIRGDANGQQSLIQLEPGMAFDPSSVDYIAGDDSEMPALKESRSGQRTFQVNRNIQGETVIDLLAGFSQKAADYIGDHEAFALAQVASVNRALQQSLVQGVRLRLVGTQVVAHDAPITVPSLNQIRNVFAEGMRRYSPDVVASFVVGTPGVDTAVGWGHMPGRYTLNAITSSTVFRHELGHNIGGGHCSDGKSYTWGYNNGRVGTILCGNHVGYFSNPDVKDSRGVPLGDADTANMARVWRERAARMSAYSPSVVPLEEERSTSILSQKVSLSSGQTRYFPVDVPEGTRRLVFSVVDGELTEKAGQVQLLLKRGAQPSGTSFDYRSVRNHNVSLGVNDPQPGRWYLAINTDNRATQDQVLEAHAYGLTQDTAQGRYLKFVATSAVDGKDNASVAELLLVDAKGKALPRESWKVISTSSAVPGAAVGNHAIDGNPNSYWSTAAGARYPHEILIDLGADSRFSQLHYLPRQDGGLSGNIKGYQVYGSNSASGAWTLLADGEFNADNEVKATSLKPVNAGEPPVAVISGKTEANAGDKIVLDASASSDPQGNALSFAWEASPRLDFDFDGARISFTAPELQADTRYRFTLTLSNGKQSSSRTHEVLIKGKATNASCKPQWTVTGTYLGNDEVQWKGRQYQARWWTSGAEPGLASTTGPDGAGKVWRDLGPCQNGGEKPVEPPVEEVKPPVAVISGTNQAKPGETVYLNASGSSDPAGLKLSYSWSVSPGVAFEAAGNLMKFVAPRVAQDVTYNVNLTVNNGKHSATRTHQVKVLAETPETVKPPLANIAGTSQAKGGETVTLDATGSSDPAGLALSYRWSVTPSVAFQATGSKLTFVAPKSDKDISYRFTLNLGNGTHTVSRDHSVTVLADKVETPAGCQGAWSPQGTYWANDKVSHNGRFYIARWWTKGNEPSAATVGGEGSGKVWRDAGACN